MKIWIKEAKTDTHNIIRLHCEPHSDFKFLGDLDDDAFRKFIEELDMSLDIEKNLKLIKYFGYLHLLINVT